MLERACSGDEQPSRMRQSGLDDTSYHHVSSLDLRLLGSCEQREQGQMNGLRRQGRPWSRNAEERQ